VSLPEDERIAPPTRGDADLPVIEEPPVESDDADVAELRSLRDDVEALIEDGKTYLETELVYQKTRAAFVADRAKGAVVYGAIAAALAVLALVGLTVGLIIALAPLLTAWGSSAVVVGALLIGAVIFMRMASKQWNGLMQAIEAPPEREP
jgi:hypothetical protein